MRRLAVMYVAYVLLYHKKVTSLLTSPVSGALFLALGLWCFIPVIRRLMPAKDAASLQSGDSSEFEKEQRQSKRGFLRKHFIDLMLVGIFPCLLPVLITLLKIGKHVSISDDANRIRWAVVYWPLLMEIATIAWRSGFISLVHKLNLEHPDVHLAVGFCFILKNVTARFFIASAESLSSVFLICLLQALFQIFARGTSGLRDRAFARFLRCWRPEKLEKTFSSNKYEVFRAKWLLAEENNEYVAIFLAFTLQIVYYDQNFLYNYGYANEKSVIVSSVSSAEFLTHALLVLLIQIVTEFAVNILCVSLETNFTDSPIKEEWSKQKGSKFRMIVYCLFLVNTVKGLDIIAQSYGSTSCEPLKTENEIEYTYLCRKVCREYLTSYRIAREKCEELGWLYSD